jgi:acyl carrier protein
MDKDLINQQLFSSIKKFQELSGEETPKLHPDLTPIGDLPGFDSQRAVETTVELEGLLKVEIPGEANLFISEDGTRALKIREIVDRIYVLLTR